MVHLSILHIILCQNRIRYTIKHYSYLLHDNIGMSEFNNRIVYWWITHFIFINQSLCKYNYKMFRNLKLLFIFFCDEKVNEAIINNIFIIRKKTHFVLCLLYFKQNFNIMQTIFKGFYYFVLLVLNTILISYSLLWFFMHKLFFSYRPLLLYQNSEIWQYKYYIIYRRLQI